MPTIGTDFYLQALLQRGTSGIRVSYSQYPLTADPNAANDALNPSQYTLTGVSPNRVVSVEVVPDDPRSIDLILETPLSVGDITVTISSQVQTAKGRSLQAPRSKTLSIASVTTDEGVDGGAQFETAESLIRKHLPASMAGRAWNAFITALAVGDKFNWDNARRAFDQLFKVSANGIYLDHRAADDGLVRPQDIGMSDDLFRQLSIKIGSNGLTQELLWEIMEIFYGSDSVRASISTTITEPFALADGRTLDLLLDGRDRVTITFKNSDFANILQAKAIEVAAAITRDLRLVRSNGFAGVFKDSVTGQSKVRVYSGSVGLGSSIKVTGGNAQVGLKFPDVLPVYSGSVTSGDSYNWVVSIPASGINRVSLTNSGGTSKLDLNQVQTGDYVVFEAANSSVAKTVYEILNVNVSFSGSALVQYFEIAASAAGHTFLQLSNQEISFFRPSLKTIHNGTASVVVSEADVGTIDVVAPATTQAVNRGIGLAAYLHDQNPLAVTSVQRNGPTVTVVANGHGLSVGNQIIVEETFAGINSPALTVGSQGTSGNPGTSDASLATIWTQTRAPDDTGRTRHQLTTLNDGRILMSGGYSTSGGIDTYLDSCALFRISATSTLGDGSKQYTYHWDSAASMPDVRAKHCASVLIDPGNASKVFLTGGHDGASYLETTVLYTPDGGIGSWTNTASMSVKRVGHQQIVLNDGNVLVIGGTSNGTTALSSCEIYTPPTDSWSSAASMGQARSDHQAVKIADGRVIVIGGKTLVGSTLLSTCEIYDPSANTWTRTGSMTFTRYGHRAVLLPDSRVLVFGGNGYRNGSEAPIVDAEVWDPQTGCWYPCGRLAVARMNPGAAYISSKRSVLVAGGATRAEYFDTRTLNWRYAPASPTSVTGAELMALVAGEKALLVGGQNLDESTANGWLYQPGEDVYGLGGINGIATVTSASANSFQFQTPDYSGLTTNQNNAATIKSMGASAAGEAIGPFVLDPLDGIAVTALQTVTTMDLDEGQHYTSLDVTDALPFPDEPGWIAIGFGTDNVVAPVRYLGRLSDTSLILDYSFKFPTSNRSGASVILLKQKGLFSPAHPEQVGVAYITASSAGRLAAIKTLKETVAAGVEVNTEIKYPSDKGLGGEGLPTTGETRLSDKIVVWGGDNLEQELAEARGEI